MCETKDINNSIVKVGSIVRVLEIKASVTARLSLPEQRDILTMKGQTFEVYEVDEWGSAWVKKWWNAGKGAAYCHSLALAPAQMELVIN